LNFGILLNAELGVKGLEAPYESHYLYHLDASDFITFVNQDWLDFAVANGTPNLTKISVLGQCLWKYIYSPETRPFYEQIFESVRTQKRNMQVAFRGDSPLLERHLVLSISALPNNALCLDGRLLVQRPITVTFSDEKEISLEQEIICQCSLCLRVKGYSQRWKDWVTLGWQYNLLKPIMPIHYVICPDCHDQAATTEL
jgi:hypothetical protein